MHTSLCQWQLLEVKPKNLGYKSKVNCLKPCPSPSTPYSSTPRAAFSHQTCRSRLICLLKLLMWNVKWLVSCWSAGCWVISIWRNLPGKMYIALLDHLGKDFVGHMKARMQKMDKWFHFIINHSLTPSCSLSLAHTYAVKQTAHAPVYIVSLQSLYRLKWILMSVLLKELVV